MLSDLFGAFDARTLALGMVALVNPCGFALLPAYLGFFLGHNDPDADESRLVALNRAQVVGLSLTAGFLTVFGLLGLVFTGLYSSIAEYVPYANLAIGVGLFVLGIAMLFGFSLLVALPKLDKGTGSRSIGSMYLFGVSYAIASLSCTIPLFLGAIGSSATGASFGEQFGGVLSYGLGMGLLATILTLLVALGQRSIVGQFRRLLPWINRISAVVLIIVGAYVALYGWWSLEVLDDPTDLTGWIDTIVVGAERFQTDLSTAISDRATPLAVGFLGINLAIAVAGLVARRARTGSDTPDTVSV